ncbi:MAG: hypothetical protein ACFFCK_08315, partial [Promethearchaeota archaeon]
GSGSVEGDAISVVDILFLFTVDSPIIQNASRDSQPFRTAVSIILSILVPVANLILPTLTARRPCRLYRQRS